MANRVGQQLGNYQLIRLLGEGGFAEVYLGEHIYLKTQAAIKILQMRLARGDREDFLNEARTIAGLKHPHIIRVLDFGIDAGTPFLVMDYAPHGTLRKRHPKGIPLPLPTIVNYVKQIAPALQYAHERKLVHRDVKPENVLLGEDDEALLSDFGIALVTQSSRYQNTQEVVGTAAYMAPEQLQGKPRPASDQYALGIIVYEWLCADRPFHGTFTELYSQHLFVPPPSLQEKVLTIPPAVEQVVMTALEKDPHKRFASVQAFATALEQACHATLSHPIASSTEDIPPSHSSPSTDGIASALPIQSPLPTNLVIPSTPLSQPTVAAMPSHALAVPPPPTEESIPSGKSGPSQQFQHRISRRAVVVGLTGLVVAGSSLVWLARSHLQSAPTTPKSLLSTYQGHSGGVDSVAWSPDGKYIASGSTDGTVRVWEVATGNTKVTYSGLSDDVFFVAWSPDSKYIASGSRDHTVQVWDASSNSNLFIYRGHSAAVRSVSWSPDGWRIASASVDKTVQVWNAVDGSHVFTFRGHSDAVTSAVWSSSGRYIASGSWDHTVQIWEATTGNTKVTYSGHSNVVKSVAWSPDGKQIASGGYDMTVQVWEAATGNTKVTYSGDFGAVDSVIWSPDGKYIASGSGDGIVRVWQAV